jgi:hypothetical protein
MGGGIEKIKSSRFSGLTETNSIAECKESKNYVSIIRSPQIGATILGSLEGCN